MKWASFQQLIALPFTLFGLPWLGTSAALVLADPLLRPTGSSGTWIGFWMLVAFAAARIAGMSFNRLIDQSFDALNPRTRDRVLPKGEVTTKQVRFIAWGSIALFLVACAFLNSTCLLLAPALVALLWGYSYLKRVTPLYHLVMALNHFFIPIFVWAAITGSVSIPALYLGAAIFCLITANDIVYGIQDIAFDKGNGLHSIATALGTSSALSVSWGLHALFLALLVDVGVLLNMSWLFYTGLVAVGGLLVHLHRSLDVNDERTINTFLFQCNTWVALTLMIFTVGAVWLKLL